MYSSSSACTKLAHATPGPPARASDASSKTDQNAATLPKCPCQKAGASSGSSAIDSNSPANGTPHRPDKDEPSSSAARAAMGISKSSSAYRFFMIDYTGRLAPSPLG